MEEIFKRAIALSYLRDQNVKDTSTFKQIDILDKELTELTDDIAKAYIVERFGNL